MVVCGEFNYQAEKSPSLGHKVSSHTEVVVFKKILYTFSIREIL